jgi:dephospho-CoA kinase
MFPFPNKVVVGITGGIACGKSTVCKKFADLGWEVVSTDSLVHQLLQDDCEVINQIINRWGLKMKNTRGSIDKVQLAHVIFKSSSDRTWLEGLLHPKVREGWMSHIQLSSHRNFVVEVPLLFENDLDALFTKTISVYASPSIQFRRLQQRGLLEAEINSRINAQMSVEEKSNRAQFVILGGGNLGFLETQIKTFLTYL